MMLMIAFLVSQSFTCKDAKHNSLFVILDGKYMSGESALVHVNGQEFGYATDSDPLIAKLEEGDYTITATTQKAPGTFIASFTKKNTNDYIFYVHCDPAEVNITANPDYALLDQTSLYEPTHFPGVEFLPGTKVKVPDVRPAGKMNFSFYDKSGKLRFTVEKTLIYKESWNLNIPYN